MRHAATLAALLLSAPLHAVAQQPTGVTGTYANGPVVISFTAEGGYTVQSGGAVMAVGRHQIHGDTIIVQDEGGPIACPDERGRYLWRRDARGLTLRVLSDPCSERVDPLTTGVWLEVRGPGVLVLRGATLIDGTGAPPRPNVDVILADGKIESVQAAGTGAIPAGADVRDVAGKWIVPGLIDAHVHLFTDPSGTDSRRAVDSHLLIALRGGVTTVRDMAGDGRALADVQRAVAAGDIPGPDIYYSALFGGPTLMGDPRVLASSRGIKPGTAGWMRLVEPGLDWRQVIAEAKGSGATGVKLYGDIPAELLSPIVAEAHRQGLRVWSHAAILPALPGDAVAAGVDVLSHADMLAVQPHGAMTYPLRRASIDYRVDVKHPALDSLLRAMARRGTILEPTLTIYQGRFVPAGVDTLPVGRFAAAITRRAHELGVPILAGTDTMTDDTPGALPNIHGEMELLVTRAGLRPMDAIVAATATAARALGIEAATGTIAPGKIASLLVLDADPLADIRNTRRIALVIKHGEPVPRK